MVMCFAPDCKHYSEKQGCRFFVFPKDLNEKRKWIALIRRKDREPSMHSLVCSCHFKDGDRKNRPTIFEHNKLKRFCDEPSTSTGITRSKQLKCSVEDIQSSSNTGNGSKILRRALNVSSLEPASQRSSTKYVNSHPSLIRSGNQQQISNESGEKVTIQNVPVSCDDRLIRKAYGAKRVRFDIPTNKENVASSKQQTTTTSTSESNFNISTTDATRVKLIPVTPNQAKNMSTPGVLIAVPSGSSEAPIQILTPNSSAVISKVVISQLQPETTDVKNIGSLSPHSSSTRATSNHISKFQYILPKPPSPTARMPDPVDEEIDIKVEDLEPVETLEIKSELDSEPDIASDKETDTSETLTASDTSETLTASETEEICAAMDKRALRYGDVDRSNETETWSGGTNYKPRCKKVRFFGDLKLEDLRRNYNRATDSWNIIQKTVQKHRELIDELSEENEELTKEINKINNALRLLKEEGYVTSDNQLIMSPPWDAVVEEPKIIEPSPSGSSNSVAKKLSFWRIEKQD
nr:unnamed protein product [Callosobruchus chinensis]